MNGKLLIFIDSFLSIFINKLIYKDESKTWKRLVSPFWNPIVRFCTNLQYDLQQPIADTTGYHRCELCTFVVYPDSPHDWCDGKLQGKNDYSEQEVIESFLEEYEEKERKAVEEFDYQLEIMHFREKNWPTDLQS